MPGNRPIGKSPGVTQRCDLALTKPGLVCGFLATSSVPFKPIGSQPLDRGTVESDPTRRDSRMHVIRSTRLQNDEPGTQRVGNYIPDTHNTMRSLHLEHRAVVPQREIRSARSHGRSYHAGTMGAEGWTWPLSTNIEVCATEASVSRERDGQPGSNTAPSRSGWG